MVQKSGGNAPVEVGSLSHYFFTVLYIPGGAGFLPSTVHPDTPFFTKSDRIWGIFTSPKVELASSIQMWFYECRFIMGFSVSDGWSSTGGISSTKNGLKWYAPPKTKKISPLKRIFLLETGIFRFHVCFREGIWDETMIVRVHLKAFVEFLQLEVRNLGNIFIYCFNVFSPIYYIPTSWIDF